MYSMNSCGYIMTYKMAPTKQAQKEKFSLVILGQPNYTKNKSLIY